MALKRSAVRSRYSPHFGAGTGGTFGESWFLKRTKNLRDGPPVPYS